MASLFEAHIVFGLIFMGAFMFGALTYWLGKFVLNDDFAAGSGVFVWASLLVVGVNNFKPWLKSFHRFVHQLLIFLNN